MSFKETKAGLSILFLFFSWRIFEIVFPSLSIFSWTPSSAYQYLLATLVARIVLQYQAVVLCKFVVLLAKISRFSVFSESHFELV